MKRKTELDLAIENLKKNLKELDLCGEEFREMGYNSETCVHNRDSKDYLFGMKILECVDYSKPELELFIKQINPNTTEENIKSFKRFSNKLTKDLKSLENDTYSDNGPYERAGIIIKNLLIALTIVGLLIFAGKAIYSAATEGRLNPHSIFYGTRKEHVQKIHDIKSDLEEIDKLLQSPSNTLFIN